MSKCNCCDGSECKCETGECGCNETNSNKQISSSLSGVAVGSFINGISFSGNLSFRNETNFDRVREFHDTYGQLAQATPNLNPFEFKEDNEKLHELRLDLIDEEVYELQDAVINDQDIVAVADALTDILYVVYGAAVAYGIDIDACFREVHRSNMSKLGADGKPIYREDGKVLKGPNYSPPNLHKVLFPEG